MSKVIRWVSIEWTKDSQVFNQLIVSSIDNAKLTEHYKTYKKELYYTDTIILWPDDEHGSYDPWMGLPEVWEKEKAPEIERRLGNTKGIYQQYYKAKITATWEFYDWMRTTKKIEWANSDIQAKVFNMWNSMTYLVNNWDKTKAQVLTKVITMWEISTNPTWPGSLTPDLTKPLFAIDHPIESLGTTQSNLVTWAFTDDATRLVKLTDAVNKMRNMRFHNWDYVYTSAGSSEPYVLKCTVTEALAWTKALNWSMKYSGQWANANAVNIFEVSNFMVKIEVLATLGTYDAQKNIIGDNTACYLMNPVYLRETSALKCYTIKELCIVTDEIKDPRSYVALAEAAFGASHYWAERWIVKLTWA